MLDYCQFKQQYIFTTTGFTNTRRYLLYDKNGALCSAGVRLSKHLYCVTTYKCMNYLRGKDASTSGRQLSMTVFNNKLFANGYLFHFFF